MPAIFKVTESSDNGVGNTVGTLSWAIKQANQTAGADELEITNDVRLNLDPSLKRMQTLINSDKWLNKINYLIYKKKLTYIYKQCKKEKTL
jgi:hypothetical protein